MTEFLVFWKFFEIFETLARRVCLEFGETGIAEVVEGLLDSDPCR